MQYYSYYPRPVFSFSSPATLSSERDLTALFLAVYLKSPLWLQSILRGWNLFMRLFGCHKLTCSADINLKKSALDYIEGDRVGRFRIILTSTKEIVLEQDERHFSLRVSLVKKHSQTQDETRQAQGASDTLFLISGRAKTRLGKQYLSITQPFLMWFLRRAISSIHSESCSSK
ncbi:DUF2867 domain-containing protein [Marinomonas balearica]|uniref:Uncharacterized protein DUF2867 n=1 Tax=Marinomonas balearica TaxID=491947 RepID=A0A4R6M7Z5_9GAMM|nr:DUF2867 domain-containing protein [Marinomonas balearica]TDO97286.1 uncharacterized protein DUF2867 [Marinomonas balearica]